jgi:hypothetical protein
LNVSTGFRVVRLARADAGVYIIMHGLDLNLGLVLAIHSSLHKQAGLFYFFVFIFYIEACVGFLLFATYQWVCLLHYALDTNRLCLALPYF